MRVIRLCKTILVASVALLFTLFAFGNLTDYGSNWAFVQHVMSMDTIFPDSTLHWRAMTDPTLQTAVYWSIIAWQVLTAIVLWIGAARMLAASSSERFGATKPTAAVGLTMAILLYAIGFVAIGSEWFAMWQSEQWNGQATAFRFITVAGIVLIVLLLPEGEGEGQRSA